MPDTLEKQLKKEILKRQQKSKPKRNRKALVLMIILGVVSLLLSIGQRQMRQSVPVPQERPAIGGQEPEAI